MNSVVCAATLSVVLLTERVVATPLLVAVDVESWAVRPFIAE